MKETRQEMPSFYSIMPADVRYDKRLKPNEKIMYSEITALSNKYGYCTAGNAYFSDLYEVSKATVSRWISHLEECGYIVTELVYGEDGKTIKGRKIYMADAYKSAENEPIDEKINSPKDEEGHDPIDKKVNTPMTKKSIGYCQKGHDPIDKKVKDNNTSNNITSINNTSINSGSIYTKSNIYTNMSDTDKAVLDCYCLFIKNQSGVDDRKDVLEAIKIYGWDKVLYTLVILRDERKTKVSSFKYVESMLKDSASYDDFVVNYIAHRELKELRKLRMEA